jgi:hypothetical protein
MRWQRCNGQAAVEAAFIIPVVLLLLMMIVAVGYGATAQLLVVTSASQGARQGAALCAEGHTPAESLAGAEQRALSLLDPLAGPKQVSSFMDGWDLLVTSQFIWTPPLAALLGEGQGEVVLAHTARYRCY